jgi:hypothetical protein
VPARVGDLGQGHWPCRETVAGDVPWLDELTTDFGCELEIELYSCTVSVTRCSE